MYFIVLSLYRSSIFMQIAALCDVIDTVAGVTCEITADGLTLTSGSTVAQFIMNMLFPQGTSQSQVRNINTAWSTNGVKT